jgi:polysaccharide export outer membrane protein
MVAGIIGGLLVACLVYCLVAPKQYEAKARLALRAAPANALGLDGSDGAYSGTFASGQTQLETLANVFRSDQLAWRVILEQKLYQSPAFQGRFAERFSGFRPDSPSTGARGFLEERFQARLHVRTVPRTLLLEIRFRSKDAGVSANVVNALIRAYEEQQSEARLLAAEKATGWLDDQLKVLKAAADRDDQRLAEFQRQHGILIAPETSSNGQPGTSQHVSALLEVDELGRELVAASSERILREAEFRAAMQGDPEQVLSSDPRLDSESGGLSISAFRQIHERRSALEQEQAQLALEHGPNFPRVVEVRGQLEDLDKQVLAEDATLRDRFKSAWQTAADREQMVRKNLEERIGEGQQVNEAAMQYEVMRREADASHELYVRIKAKAEEAGLAAGVHGSDFWIVDAANPPAKPASPDLPLDMAITLFVGLWLAAGGAFLMETIRPSGARAVMILLCGLTMALAAHAQAPTPNTSGLPSGVARTSHNPDTTNVPNPKEAPPVWTGPGAPPPGYVAQSGATTPYPGAIVPGEILDVSEFHTPEFHSTVRVSAAGTVNLPLIGEVNVNGMDEPAAAKAIAAALVSKGMLLHPQVSVMVTVYVGQDVTVMGEVARPGVYPYSIHHRLLDLISAASGLNVTAGGLVRVIHRDDPGAAQLVTLDFSADAAPTQNPELQPGDTVEVSRAGLVYVVGDVNRPGGFTLDPQQQTTILQALSLAWGPSQNAALQKALLIHEEKGGRVVTTLNLKKILRGQDPDLPMNEHDILFVPDSAAKNLWNRTMESVVQSAAGVSIYAGLVYSQRF